MNRAPADALKTATLRVPVRWRAEVERVLITEEQIERRIQTLSREI